MFKSVAQHLSSARSIAASANEANALSMRRGKRKFDSERSSQGDDIAKEGEIEAEAKSSRPGVKEKKKTRGRNKLSMKLKKRQQNVIDREKVCIVVFALIYF